MNEWFQSLQKREQVVLASAAVILVVLGIYLYVIEPVMISHDAKIREVDNKIELIGDADRYLASRGGSSTTGTTGGSQDSLTLIVANTANANGLRTAYRSSSPTGNDAIRVNFENAGFDDLVRWLGILSNAHGLNVSQARMTDRSETGRVDASFVLQRS
ncbi:MAG: type II secretion system protein GspM [Pseudomonadota bacterium]